MVVGYRAHYINELLIKALVKTEKANLIDIIANSNEIPEFIFSNCTPENLSKAIKVLLSDSTLTAKQLELSRKVMKSLGFGGSNPGDRAAESVIDFVKIYEKKSPLI
jgi:lipid-A-disaccharide synthase